MNLVRNYADAFLTLDHKVVVAYMKKRGHLSLLPRIKKYLESRSKVNEVVIVANEQDAKKMKGNYPDAAVVVDERIVGGYTHRKGSLLTDRSYRSALVKLYQNVIAP